MSYNDKDYFLDVYDDLLMMMVMAADLFFVEMRSNSLVSFMVMGSWGLELMIS